MTKAERSIELYVMAAAIMQVIFGATQATIYKDGISNASFEVYQFGILLHASAGILGQKLGASESIFRFMKRYAFLVIGVDCLVFIGITVSTIMTENTVARWLLVGTFTTLTGCVIQHYWEQVKQEQGQGRVKNALVQIATGFGYMIGVAASLLLAVVFGYKFTVVQASLLEITGCCIDSLAVAYMVRHTLLSARKEN